jgi:pyruvate, water dikinase
MSCSPTNVPGGPMDFFIGCNDLTQLVLGIDRGSSDLAHLFDKRNAAAALMLQGVIAAAHQP